GIRRVLTPWPALGLARPRCALVLGAALGGSAGCWCRAGRECWVLASRWGECWRWAGVLAVGGSAGGGREGGRGAGGLAVGGGSGRQGQRGFRCDRPARQVLTATLAKGVFMAVTSTYTVTGMTCSHCVQAVTGELSSLPGVADVRVDLASGAVTVTSEAPLA